MMQHVNALASSLTVVATDEVVNGNHHSSHATHPHALSSTSGSTTALHMTVTAPVHLQSTRTRDQSPHSASPASHPIQLHACSSLNGVASATIDPRNFGSLKSSPTSSTSSLLDSGHAFEWPVPRATSTNALDDIHDQLTDAAILPTGGTDITLEHCMAAQNTFINVLMDIGDRLRRFPTKDMRQTQLFGELALLNLNLPARVYMPLGTAEETCEWELCSFGPNDWLTNSFSSSPSTQRHGSWKHK